MTTRSFQHRLIHLAISLLFVVLGGRAAAANGAPARMCAVNTGLNPACPLTASGVSLHSTTLNTTATQHGVNLIVQRTLRSETQIFLSLPVQNSLTITGVGTADGIGDAMLGLWHVFSTHRGRLMHTVGGNASLPTGANAFTTGRTTLDPFYAISYAPLRYVQFVFTTDYAFGIGGTRLPFARRVQTLQFSPRAIIDLGHRFFISGSATQARVSGDYRYTSYVASSTVGFIGPHASFSLSYNMPLGLYSRNITFDHALTVDLSLRP